MAHVTEIEGKPLKDWVNAPYGAFAKAVRKSHDPDWGMDLRITDCREYEVLIDYSYSGRGRATFTVTAHNEKEAEKLALEKFDSDTGSLDFWDAEVDDAEVRSVTATE